MISRRGFIASLLTLPLVGKALVMSGVNPVIAVAETVPEPCIDSLAAVTTKLIYPRVISDHFFRGTPFLAYLKNNSIEQKFDRESWIE